MALLASSLTSFFFFLTAPKLFTVIFNILKPFVAQETQAKMKIFSSNRKEWTAALLEEIDAEQLPAFYGGTMVDPDGDPKCPSKVPHHLSSLSIIFKNSVSSSCPHSSTWVEKSLIRIT